MNGNYYQNPTFPANDYTDIKEKLDIPQVRNEEEKRNTFLAILKKNNGKKIKVNLPKINDKTYEGILENVSDDFIIIRDNLNNTWYLINNNKLHAIEFLEPITY